MIRVLVADGHPLFRERLRGLLATVPDTEVVAIAGDGEEAVRRALELRPDVVFDGPEPGHLLGLETTRRIAAAAPEIAVLVLTMVDNDESVVAALSVGAHGYVMKGSAQEDVCEAIRTVVHGGSVFGPAVAEQVLARNRGGAAT